MSKIRKGLIQEAETESAWHDWKQRTAGRRPKGRYYLIVCEGEATEPNYFEAIARCLPKDMVSRITVKGVGDNTLGLIDAAKTEIAKRKAKVAVARKLATVMFAMLRSGRPYEDAAPSGNAATGQPGAEV